MGAWGVGPFENDGAMDFVADLRAGDFTLDGLAWAFEDEEYLEVDGGQMALALAEVAVAIRQNAPSPVSDLDLSAVAVHFTPENVAFIHAQVKRTLSDAEHSELYELWEETPDFEAWLTVSRRILQQLSPS